MELGKRNFTARPCEPGFVDGETKEPERALDIDLVGGLGHELGPRREQAARWNTTEISNSLLIRSSRW
jgi:hypothetical protein